MNKTEVSRAKTRLISLLTAYDKKQSTKRNHSIYALGQYMQAADEWEKKTNAGKSPLGALYDVFTSGANKDFSLAPVRAFSLTLGEGIKANPVKRKNSDYTEVDRKNFLEQVLRAHKSEEEMTLKQAEDRLAKLYKGPSKDRAFMFIFLALQNLEWTKKEFKNSVASAGELIQAKHVYTAIKAIYQGAGTLKVNPVKSPKIPAFEHVVIKKKPSTGEFLVYPRGKPPEGSKTYFADVLDDAIATAGVMDKAIAKNRGFRVIHK